MNGLADAGSSNKHRPPIADCNRFVIGEHGDRDQV
jgi:hypothetical protein